MPPRPNSRTSNRAGSPSTCAWSSNGTIWRSARLRSGVHGSCLIDPISAPAVLEPRARAAVQVEHVRTEALAQEHLRLEILDRVLHELDHVEVQVRERAAHLVVLVLGLDDDLVEARG